MTYPTRFRQCAGLAATFAVAGGLVCVATPAFARPATTPTSSDRAVTRSTSAETPGNSVRLCGPHPVGCQAMVVTTSKNSNQPRVTPRPVGYGADDLRAVYHLPAASVGKPGTVALVETGAYPSLESDLARYRAQYHLPACTVANGCLSVVNYKGGAPLPPASPDEQFLEFNADGETALDLDMVSAACPGCRILVVQAPLHDVYPQSQAENDQAAADFGTAVQTSVRRKAAAVSMSYSFYADAATDTGSTARNLYQPGTAVVASTGDAGYNGFTNFNGESQSGWPENLPWVTAVGGTEVFADHSGRTTTYQQTAWEFGGSGCGYDLPPALGQNDAIAAHCDGHRAASDISAIADNVAVYFTYEGDGGWEVFGGTSASTPFVGALYARAGVAPNTIGPNTLYAAPNGTFDDVTIGQNVLPNECSGAKQYALCHAGPNWDGPSGLGTPHGLRGL